MAKQTLLLEVKKVIDEVKATKNWKLLDPFIQGEKVKSLTPLNSLAHSDLKCLADLLYERGEMLFEKSVKEEELKEAIKALEVALFSDPQHRKAAACLARVQFKIGLLKPDLDEKLLLKAKDLFSKASDLHHQQMQPLSFESLWDFGLCLYMIAKKSEEAIDLKLSIEKFQEGYDRGFSDPEFILDYGTALAELAVLIGNHELLSQAADLLEESVKGCQESSSAWLRLACVYKILFFALRDIFYFEKADQCFVGAARLGGQPYTLWLNWGLLLLIEGKAAKDPDILKNAIEKLQTAESQKTDDPFLRATLGDALMHLGMLEESYDHLKDASFKFSEAIEMNPKDPDFLRLLGDCLTHIGTYFNDPRYVLQAIGEYEKALQISEECLLAWQGLARSYYLLGNMKGDPNEFETSAKFCAQVIKMGGNLPAFWNDWGMALARLGDEKGDSEATALAIEKFEEAITLYNREGKGYPDPDWYLNLGCCLDQLGELIGDTHLYERSISVLSRLLEQFPKATEVRYRLALALYHLGDEVNEVEILELALEHFNILIQEPMEEEEVYHDMGVVLLTIAYLLREGDELFSSDEEKIQKYIAKAESLFFKSLSLGGQVANYYLGCLFAFQENFAEAMHYMERAKAAKVLPPLEVLLRDEWLTTLRQTSKFRSFLQAISDER